MDIGTGRAILFLYACYRENFWHFESKGHVGNSIILYHRVHSFHFEVWHPCCVLQYNVRYTRVQGSQNITQIYL